MGIVCAIRADLLGSAAYVGGNYNANPNHGLFYLNANNAASNTNGNLGSRLLVWTPALHGRFPTTW